MTQPTRRSFLATLASGLGLAICAPALVRVGSLDIAPVRHKLLETNNWPKVITGMDVGSGIDITVSYHYHEDGTLAVRELKQSHSHSDQMVMIAQLKYYRRQADLALERCHLVAANSYMTQAKLTYADLDKLIPYSDLTPNQKRLIHG